MLARVRQLRFKADSLVNGRLSRLEGRLEVMHKSIELASPIQQLKDRETALVMLKNRLDLLGQGAVDGAENEFRMLCARLEGVNPLSVLSHGYSMVEGEDGRIISSVGDVDPGDRILVRLADGEIGATVSDTRLNNT
jgi:exodeoxyribonuclease VII large subunit